MTLATFARTISALRASADREPLRHMRWLPGQQAFLSDPSPRKLFRAGNQAMGKTTCGLADVVFRCLGEHPFLDVPTPPIEAWVLCASWSQSLAVQTKLWDMLPKHRVHAELSSVRSGVSVGLCLLFVSTMTASFGSKQRAKVVSRSPAPPFTARFSMSLLLALESSARFRNGSCTQGARESSCCV